jgi:hypothetical protein
MFVHLHTLCRHLLREDMYQQAVNFLPALTQDMGSLCTSSVAAEQGGDVTTMTVTQCMYHDMLTQVRVWVSEAN